MILQNYSIADDFIALIHNEVYLDLHNNYDFESLKYSTHTRKLSLYWNRSAGEWVNSNHPNSLIIEFEEVSLFKALERDETIPFTEDDCMDSMGFIHHEMLDEVRGFATSEPLKENDHLNISFASGFAFKIAAESSFLRIIGQKNHVLDIQQSQ